MPDLPSGTVTFLFTDVEGSTRLLHELGAEAYAGALAEHRRLIRDACVAHGGVEVDTQGDAFFFAFPTAPGGLSAAAEMTGALAAGPIRVRIGLHTGTPLVSEEGYVGDDVHFAARVAASGHGGQIVLSAATAALVEPSYKLLQGNALLELGEHRLKDIAQPVAIFQLGEGSFPPLKTISNTNLPRPASSFVGRELELAEVLERMERGARLVTLTGPGGSGKTRLAIEAAATLVPEYKAGVFWVGLAALRDSTLVTETIAQTLGAKDGLAEHVGERELLLLLDNLEQVIGAAPELAALLEACPNLTLLVTSRELLRVRGEVEYSVLPLAEPEAVTLFCERAQTEPTATIAELCARLDNLPLAVELAAARTKALSPARILQRLSQRLDLLKGGRDADPRQQTLRATIEWSHDLLTDGAQQLFARLSVFAGGCTLEAAEDAADADLDSLQSLVEKSLLRFTDERYWMLETIREYTSERLESSTEADDIRKRHGAWFLRFAEEAEPHLRGSPKEWLDRLERDHDNLRAAFDHLEARGQGEAMQRLCGGLWRFWSLRGHLTEGRRRTERALAADGLVTLAHANALNGATVMAVQSGDNPSANSYGEKALALHRQLGNPWGVANSAFLLGVVAADRADWARAQRLFAESLERFKELDDEHYTLLATRNLAWTYYEQDDRSGARVLHEQNLERARAAGNERIQAMTLSALASYALDDGRLHDAALMLREGMSIHHELRDLVELAVDLTRAARALGRERKAEPAVRLLAGVETLYGELGVGPPSWSAYEYEEALSGAHAQLDEAAFSEAWKQGEKLTLDQAVEHALTSLD